MKQKNNSRGIYSYAIINLSLLILVVTLNCSSDSETRLGKESNPCNAGNSIPNRLICPNMGKIPINTIMNYPSRDFSGENEYCVEGTSKIGNTFPESYITNVKKFNTEYLFDNFLYVYETVCGGKPPFFGEIEFAKNIVSEAKKEDRRNFTDTVRLRSGKILQGVKASVTKDSVVVVDSNGNASVYRKSEVHSVDRK